MVRMERSKGPTGPIKLVATRANSVHNVSASPVTLAFMVSLISNQT